MNDLELVDTKELVTELLRRCDVGGIVLNQDRTTNEHSFVLCHRGPMLAVIGLMELGKTRLIDFHKEGIHDSSVTEVLANLADDDDDDDSELEDIREMGEDEEFDFIDDPTELEDETDYDYDPPAGDGDD